MKDIDMDRLVKDLSELITFRSVYNPKDTKPVKDAAQHCVDLLKGAGVTDVEQKSIGDPPDQHAPLVYARCGPDDAPEGAPRVLLYSHYDVVEAGSWGDAAWNPTKKDGRLYGRGSADDKSGVMMHLGTLRAFEGKPPVPLTIVLEGEEESGDTLEDFVGSHPELFKADVIVVADSGNYKLGKPTLTTSLRGVVAVDVTVSTLKKPVHSGVYGGPVPDAFMALVRMLAPLLDEKGDVAVHDLDQTPLTRDRTVEESELREDAGVLPDVNLIGTDTIANLLHAKPSVNVVGLSGPPPMSAPLNQLTDTATARVSLRIAPTQDPKKAVDALRQFLDQPALNPWHAEVTIKEADSGPGYLEGTPKPDYLPQAQQAMSKAYGASAEFTGDGGAIPLVTQLQVTNPDATVLVIGCEEPKCNIHSSPESVDLGELEKMTLAEAYLLDLLGKAE
ncbi:M20/M25/M40 family metallo-hydrolase [Kitasatospora sp. NPDC056651]|uniref:M20/M25/M40 family metallo-hydrolase n=1 Tax=Kitasatospora sp. NPDC056651 TaxID=3345892 RepID=UPI0036A93CA0